MNDEQDIVLEPEEGAQKPKKEVSEEAGSPDISDQADDVVSEESDDPAAQVKKLREKLKIAVDEKQKYLDGWQRERATILNLRKKDEEAKQQFMKYAEEEFMMDLIPVLDSFTMARANKEAWEKVDKNWRVGVEIIQSQLNSVLEKHGIELVDPIGQEYDPTIHEAIEMIPAQATEQDGKIIEVVQKGYKLHDKIIRAPKVKVGEYKK